MVKNCLNPFSFTAHQKSKKISNLVSDPMSSNRHSQSFNAEQFKDQQREMWDSVAKEWHSWWPTIERGAQRVCDKLVELADVISGDRVLDIATGIGEPAVTAAKRASPNGRVVATDISSQMIAIAQSRAKSLGLDGIMEFIVTDAEQLDFPNSSFDAILSRWGLMLLPNISLALTRIRLLLASGGIFAAAVWSLPSKVPLLDLAFSAVRKEINVPEPPSGIPGPFALANADALEQSFGQAKFNNIRLERVDITINFDSAESYTRFHYQVSAPIQAILINQTEEKKRQVWDAITDTVASYADSHGRVNLDNEVICIAGAS